MGARSRHGRDGRDHRCDGLLTMTLIATKNGVPIIKDGSIAAGCGCCRNSSRECCPGSDQIAYAYEVTIEGVQDRLDVTERRVPASQINGTHCLELVSSSAGGCVFAAKGCSIITESEVFRSECEEFLRLIITPVFSGSVFPVRVGTSLRIALRNFFTRLSGTTSVYVPAEDTQCPFDEITIPISGLGTAILLQDPYDMTNATATIRPSECVQPACNQADKCRFWCSEFGSVEDICTPEVDVRLEIEYPNNFPAFATATLPLGDVGWSGVMLINSEDKTTGAIASFPFNVSLTPVFCPLETQAGVRMMFTVTTPGINFGGTAYTQCYQMPHSCAATEDLEFTMTRIASIFTINVPAKVQILC